MDRKLSVAQQPLDTGSVNLLGHYSGFISRMIAFVIDTTIISISVIVFTWLINTTFEMLQGHLLLDFLVQTFPAIQSITDAAFQPVIAGILIWLFTIFYHVLLWFFTGQTIGKALIGLRVVPLSGGRLPIWRAFLRYFGYYLSALALGLGFLWIILDKRRMAWHDKLAHTCVIYTWEARPDERFLQYATRMVSSRREAINEMKAQQKRLKLLIQNKPGAGPVKQSPDKD
jgi:uncharacterized RDD family membrane protein YckC